MTLEDHVTEEEGRAVAERLGIDMAAWAKEIEARIDAASKESITESAITEIRHNGSSCTHRDIVGDSAWKNYAGVFFCGICGKKGENK